MFKITYLTETCQYQLVNGSVHRTSGAESRPHKIAFTVAGQHKERPELVSRLYKAADLVVAGHVELVAAHEDERSAYYLAKVASEGGKAVYQVTQQWETDYENWELVNGEYRNGEKFVVSCDCPDWRAPKVKGRRKHFKCCKHVLATQIAFKLRRDGLADPITGLTDVEERQAKKEAWEAERAAELREGIAADQKSYQKWYHSSYGAQTCIRKRAANGAKSFDEKLVKRAKGEATITNGAYVETPEVADFNRMAFGD